MDERNASAKDILRIDPIGSDNLSALMIYLDALL